MKVTIFTSLYDKEPVYSNAEKVVRRFASRGEHTTTIEKIRQTEDKEETQELKKSLPIICFGGKFKTRKKSELIEGSGLIILDFDEGDNLKELREKMNKWESTYSTFESPSGKGRFKALIRTEKVTSDEEYKRIFAFFEENYPVDKSGKNVDRACFISYDPNLYINTQAKPFTLEMIKRYERKRDTTKIIRTVTDIITSAPRGEGHNAVLKASYLGGGLISSGQVDEGLLVSELKRAAAQRRPNEIKDSYQAIEDTLPIGKQKPLYDLIEIEHAVSNLKPKVDPSSFIVKRDKIDKDSLDYYNDKFDWQYKTGIPDLDYYLSLRKNSFDYMVGGSKAGKTTLKLYINTFLALKYGLRTLALCFENDEMEVQDMVIGFVTGDDPKWVFRNNRTLYNQAVDFFHSHFSMLNLPPDYGFLDLLDIVGKINSQGDYFQLWIDPIFKLPGTEDYAGNKEIARHAEPFANEVMSLFISMHPIGRAQKEGGHIKDLDAEFGSMYGNAADMTFAISREFRDPEEQIRNTVNMSIDRVRSKKLKGGMETIKDCPIKWEYKWKEHNYDLWVPTKDNAEIYVRHEGGLLKRDKNKLL